MDELLIQKFREKINSYSAISETSFERLLEIATVINLKRNEILVQQGFMARQFCFLYSGYIVAYVNDAAGRIYNKNIAVNDDFIASTVSCILNQPSKFTIKAVTDCVILSLP